MDEIKEISQIIEKLDKNDEIYKLLCEILSESELDILSKRWRILKMLDEGYTQRDIAKTLNVSLCKVTRGAKILKNENSVIRKYLMKG